MNESGTGIGLKMISKCFKTKRNDEIFHVSDDALCIYKINKWHVTITKTSFKSLHKDKCNSKVLSGKGPVTYLKDH